MVRILDAKTVLQNPTRQRILDLVQQRSGLSMSDLARELSVEPSTIIWHTNKMRRANLVRSDRVGHIRVFYPVSGGIQAKQHGIAAAHLRQPCTQWVYSVVTRNPGAAISKLAELAGMSPSTVRWHVERLASSNLVYKAPAGRGHAVYPLPCALGPLAVAPCASSDVFTLQQPVA